VRKEPRWSDELHADDAWEPDWITNRFSATLTCGNSACGEVSVVSGSASVADRQFEDHSGWNQEYVDWFTPEWFHPAPPVFRIPSQCPTAIGRELERAFALLWYDPPSSANHMRSAVEALLDDRRVQKRVLNGKGKYQRLNLHDRIGKYHSAASEPLLAIKWLGNAGSHLDFARVTRADVLDGLYIFEHVIELTFVKKATHVMKLARSINRTRGPRRSAKKGLSLNLL
jgi:hypothetical protein